jgi:1-acyl-sn-glycerol-3-phosphate acyltransferase
MAGVDRIPDGACIFATNHPNREEILLVNRLVNRPLRTIIDAGLMDRQFLLAEIDKALQDTYRFPSWFGRLNLVFADWIARQHRRLGCIPVVRDSGEPGAFAVNRAAFRESIRALEKGEAIAMAPEGGLTPTGGIGELQQGVAQLAWHFARQGRQLPVLPTIFHGSSNLERSLLSRGRIVIAIGEPLLLEPQPGEPRKAAFARFTSELRTAMVELSDALSRQGAGIGIRS